MQAAGAHRFGYRTRAVNGVDGAHVVAVPVLLLAPVGKPHAERGAEQRGFDIVHAQGVAAQHGVNPVAADERAQPFHSTRVHHHRAGHHDNL